MDAYLVAALRATDYWEGLVFGVLGVSAHAILAIAFL